MKLNRHQKGGTLALVVSIFAGVVLIVGFVVLNYSQLFTHQKQAQTSIDAAALACAKELGKVTIQSDRFGKVGLIDNYGTNGLLENPVYGINTLVARVRLDMLIANKLNNSTIMYLLRRDYDGLTGGNGIINQLKTAVQNYGNGTGTAQDAQGANLPSIQQTAMTAYSQNLRLAAGRQGGAVPAMNVADFRVQVGYLQGSQGNSNIPTPMTDASGAAVSATDAQVTPGTNTVSIAVNGEPREFYRAYMNIPVSIPTGTLPFQFSCLDDQPRIVDRNSFTSNPPAVGALANGVAPTVVRVEFRGESVVAQSASGTQHTRGTKIEVACANLGGRRVTPTAGIFRLEFPQGIPDAGTSNVNFNTVKGFLDEAQLADAGDGSVNESTEAGSNDGWRGHGRYFTAEGGPFPGPVGGTEGTIVESDIGDRRQDFPSVSLAFFVYDWLRNDGLRPNINQVVAAFNRDLTTMGYGPQLVYSDGGVLPLEQPAYAAPTLPPGCRPVDFDLDGPVFGAIFDMVPNSDVAFGPLDAHTPTDPRALNGFSEQTRNDFREQANTFRMILSAPQQAAWAGPQAMAYGIDTGSSLPQTVSQPVGGDVNSNSVYCLPLFRIANGNTQAVCMASYNQYKQVKQAAASEARRNADLAQPYIDAANAYAAAAAVCTANNDTPGYNSNMAARQQQLDAAQPYLDAMQKEIDVQSRCEAVYTCLVGFIGRVTQIDANMLALTSRGLTRTTGNSDLYRVGDAALFSEPTHVPTVSELRNTSGGGLGPAIPTGQNSGGPGNKNWVNNAVLMNNAQGFTLAYKSPAGDPMFMPAYATTFGYTAMKNFRFVTIGDVSQRKDGGKVQILVLNPGAGGSQGYTAGVQTLLKGQKQYQALNVVEDTLSGVTKPTGVTILKVLNPGDTTVSSSPTTLPDLFVMWSMIGQDNVAAPGIAGSDTRDPNSPGNQFDLDNTGNCDSNESTCNNEAVRFQVTSPLLRTNVPLDPIPTPPSVGGDFPVINILPPPQPPRQGH